MTRRNIKITKASWLNYKDIIKARETLRQCPDADVREEGLAALRGARSGYLLNLITQDHPDRIAAVKWVMENW